MNKKRIRAAIGEGAVNPPLDFEIIDDSQTGNEAREAAADTSWKILIVDDDEEVHASTRFALRNVNILDRPLTTLHCHDAEAALTALSRDPDIAVAILDVVMGSADSGLRLVEKIREEGFGELRIILRTGQPGYAPEQAVLRTYDINDYRTKSELTKERLISILITALRSYSQLHIINQSKQGLELVIDSTNDLFKRSNLQLFATGVLTQLVSLFCTTASGVVYRSSDRGKNADHRYFTAIAGSGRFETLVGRDLDAAEDQTLKETLEKAQKSSSGVVVSPTLGLYFSAQKGARLFVYADACPQLTESSIALLKLFAGNIAIGFENISLLEQLDHLAFLDPILSIPNRNAFEVAFNELKEQGSRMNLVLVHINALHQTISAFGTGITKEALITIKSRLQEALPVAPLFVGFDGGADFILLADPSMDIRAINDVFDQPTRVQKVELSFSIAISVVEISDDTDAQMAFRYATSALVEAKMSTNSNIAHYDESMTESATERLSLQASLRNSLADKVGIEAYFQPKVDCKTRQIVGAEALCRWRLNGEFISPGKFIPIAEASGLSKNITDLIITEIGEYAAGRREKNLSPLPVAINLSMRDLEVKNFYDRLLEKISAAGLSPATIEFEMTESVMMHDPRYVVRELEKLRDDGYKICIDDFGTGYSSLNYIEKLPLHTLKIDKAFIETLTPVNARNSMAAIAITVAEKMDLTVVAEGIETEEQHNMMLFLGCDVCQGYLYGKPMPMAEFSELQIEVDT